MFWLKTFVSACVYRPYNGPRHLGHCVSKRLGCWVNKHDDCTQSSASHEGRMGGREGGRKGGKHQHEQYRGERSFTSFPSYLLGIEGIQREVQLLPLLARVGPSLEAF